MHEWATARTRMVARPQAILVLSLPETIETNYECGGGFRSSSLALEQSMASRGSVFKCRPYLGSASST
jgi:hypothetical protein